MAKGTVEKLNIGIVGVRRGGSFYAAIAANGARVHAVCDLSEEALAEAAEKLSDDVERYTSYETMLDASELDAVIVSTPMNLHAPQSVQALEKGLHVLSEVTAAISVEQCRDLVAACKTSSGVYMMGENVNYTRPNVLVKALVERGLFGELTYAEGEYLHELKELNERTPWRRIWQTGVRGITYGTHPLGPILDWMDGDRIVRVCCEGSGSHYTDPRGKPYHDDTSVMLAKTDRGALIKVRVDMISERPHVTTTYQLQGTKGVYESSRRRDEANRIWLEDLCEDKLAWKDLAELEADHLPEIWRAPSDQALRAGHGGSDYYVVHDFIRLIRGEEPWCRIGIHEAMDLTLPGLISQQSIEREGAWIEVPDTREW